MDIAKWFITIGLFVYIDVEAEFCYSDRRLFQRISYVEFSFNVKKIISFFAHHRCYIRHDISRYCILVFYKAARVCILTQHKFGTKSSLKNEVPNQVIIYQIMFIVWKCNIHYFLFYSALPISV